MAFKTSQHRLRQSAWSTLTLTLNWMYAGNVPIDGKGRRENPHMSMWWIQQGEATVDFRDGRIGRAVSDEWLVLPPGTRIQSFSPDAFLYSFCCIARWPDGRPLLNRGLPVTLSKEEGRDLVSPCKRLHRFVLRELRQDPYLKWRSVTAARVTPQVFLKLEEYLFHFLRHLLNCLEQKGVHPETHEIKDVRVLDALDLLENLPINRMPKLTWIAGKNGLSESQLTRQFKHAVGHTPSMHLHLRKMDEAGALLMQSDVPLKEVAFRLGFPSQSAFSNWCVHHLGDSPRKLRNRYQTASSSAFV